jgi:hypothetical protein
MNDFIIRVQLAFTAESFNFATCLHGGERRFEPIGKRFNGAILCANEYGFAVRW